VWHENDLAHEHLQALSAHPGTHQDGGGLLAVAWEQVGHDSGMVHACQH
jgi:hypothetical protein